MSGDLPVGDVGSFLPDGLLVGALTLRLRRGAAWAEADSASMKSELSKTCFGWTTAVGAEVTVINTGSTT